MLASKQIRTKPLAIMFRLLLLLVLFPGLCWGAALVSQDLAQPSIQINDKNGTLVIDVSYRVPVSPRAAWAVLTDFENMPSFIPNLDSSRVLLRNGRTIQVEQKGNMQFGLLPLHYESTRQIETTPYQSIRSHTLSGDTRLESVMALSPARDGTLLSYHATAVSDLPVPSSLVSTYLSSMLESQFKAMSGEMIRRVHAGGSDNQTAQTANTQSNAQTATRQSRLAPKKIIHAQAKKRPG